MDKVRKFFGWLVPAVVIGGVGFFIYYSLYIYKPSGHLACGSVVAQQTDIAVHVVRQWAGKEGQQYQGCQESSQ